MNNLIFKIISAILSLITVFVFILTLAVGYVRFTVYDQAEFKESVGELINDEYIKNHAVDKIDTVSSIYGFDPSEIIKLLEDIDFDNLSNEYFSDLYDALLNGDSTLPVTDFNSEAFAETIAKEFLSSLRPELYEIEENREMLAEKYNEVIRLSVSALSLDSISELFPTLTEHYLRVVEIGKYFLPLLVTFAVCLVLLLLILIIKKWTGSVYSIFLSLFTVSLLFTVPFGYLSSQNLVSRFNVNLGAGYVYLEAIWNVMVTDAAKVFAIVSGALLFLLIVSMFVDVFAKRK